MLRRMEKSRKQDFAEISRFVQIITTVHIPQMTIITYISQELFGLKVWLTHRKETGLDDILNFILTPLMTSGTLTLLCMKRMRRWLYQIHRFGAKQTKASNCHLIKSNREDHSSDLPEVLLFFIFLQLKKRITVWMRFLIGVNIHNMLHRGS